MTTGVDFDLNLVTIGAEQIEVIKKRLLATEAASKKLNDSFKAVGLSDRQAAKAAAMFAEQEKTKHAEKIQAQKKQIEFQKAVSDSGKESFGALVSGALAATTAVVGLGVALASGLIKIGTFAFEAAQFKQETMRALTYVEGSAKAAQETYKTLNSYSRLGGQQKTELAQALILVRQAGFDRASSEDILAAVTDISARGGNGGAFAKALQQLKVKERLDSSTLSQIASSINDPFFEKEFLKAVGKSRGLSVNNAVQIESVKGLLDAGVIKEAEGLKAILGLVERRVTSGGKLGSAAIDNADKSWQGQLNRLKEGLAQVLENVNITPIIEALGRVAKAFDPASESGKKFAKTFESMFQGVGKALEKYLTPENIEKALKTIGDIIDGVKQGFESFFKAAEPGFQALGKALGGGKDQSNEFADTFKSIGKVAGSVVSAIAEIVALMVKFEQNIGFGNAALLVFLPPVGVLKIAIEALAKAFTAVYDKAKEAFEYIKDKAKGAIDSIKGALGFDTDEKTTNFGTIVDGIKNGIINKTPEAVAAAKNLAKEVTDATKKELKINSPSKVFEELGEFTAQGFSKGFGSSAESPDVSLFSPTKGGQSVASNSSKTVSNTFNITLNMDKNSSPADIEIEVRKIFERVALELST